MCWTLCQRGEGLWGSSLGQGHRQGLPQQRRTVRVQGMHVDVFKFDSSCEFLYPDKNNSSLLSTGQAACFSPVRDSVSICHSILELCEKMCVSILSCLIRFICGLWSYFYFPLVFPCVMLSVYFSVCCCFQQLHSEFYSPTTSFCVL